MRERYFGKRALWLTPLLHHRHHLCEQVVERILRFRRLRCGGVAITTHVVSPADGRVWHDGIHRLEAVDEPDIAVERGLTVVGAIIYDAPVPVHV